MNTDLPVHVGLYKPAYLALSILELSKILMVWLCKKKYGEKYADSFIAYIETDNIYEDIIKDVEIRFDTSSHEWHRSLTKGKNNKVIGLMKDQLAEKIITKFVGLRQKIYSYLVDDGSEDKKRKTHKKVCIKRKIYENLKIIKSLKIIKFVWKQLNLIVK